MPRSPDHSPARVSLSGDRPFADIRCIVARATHLNGSPEMVGDSPVRFSTEREIPAGRSWRSGPQRRGKWPHHSEFTRILVRFLLGCKQKLSQAVNDNLGLEDT